MLRAADLYPTAERHFGPEAGHYGRRLGEAQPSVDFPRGRRGPGGAAIIERIEQVAVYVLGLAASPTARGAPAAVRRYRDMTGYVEAAFSPRDPVELLRRRIQDARAALLVARQEGQEEVELPPEMVAFVDQQEREADNLWQQLEASAKSFPLPAVLEHLLFNPHSLLGALTALLDAMRSAEERELLRGCLEIAVNRSWPTARIIITPRSGDWYALRYLPREGVLPLAVALGQAPPAPDRDERDVGVSCVFTDRFLREFGELLETAAAPPREETKPASEREDAPQAEAGGASSMASHRGANPGPAGRHNPRANGDCPTHCTGQFMTAGTKLPPGSAAGGSPYQLHPLQRGEDDHHERASRRR